MSKFNIGEVDITQATMAESKERTIKTKLPPRTERSERTLKQGKMFTMRIPLDLYETGRIVAELRGVSLAKLLTDGLQKEIEKDKKQVAKAKEILKILGV